MTMESDLTALLKATCQRVYPDFAPANTPRPYVTYQQIYGIALRYLGNEVPTKQHAVIQINVWADTRKEAKATILAIEEGLVKVNGDIETRRGRQVRSCDVVEVNGTGVRVA